MPKHTLILGALFVFLFSGLAFAQQEEHLTITTYYPSPYGSYNELRTNQMVIGDTNSSTTPAPGFSGALTFKEVTTTQPASKGTMYFDGTNFKYSPDGNNWKEFGGG